MDSYPFYAILTRLVSYSDLSEPYDTPVFILSPRGFHIFSQKLIRYDPIAFSKRSVLTLVGRLFRVVYT